MSLVEVENLNVTFKLRSSRFAPARHLRAVRNVSFTIDDGVNYGFHRGSYSSTG